MTLHPSKTLWLKFALLGGLALGAAACTPTEPDQEDFYEPITHYQRHPIVVTKTGAHAKDCGGWPADVTDTAENQPYANFGCAQQNNIAAMVANPQDLVRPRKQTPSDATRRAIIIDKYRQGTTTAAEREAGQKVKISDVAGGE